MAAPDAEILQLLAALGSQERETRTAAEKALAAARHFDGFGSKLVSAFGRAAADVPVPLRQMSLTVLKQLVNDRWAEMAPSDTAAVRQTLLEALAEESTALRPLLHACAVQVRLVGGSWPALEERLLAGLAQGTVHEAGSCVECVKILLDDGGAEVATSMVQLQEPLLRRAADPALPPSLRCKCVDAYVAGIGTLVACTAANPNSAILAAAVAGLPSWLGTLGALCGGGEGWSDVDRVASAFTAVRAATSLSRLPPLRPALAEGLEAVLRPACLLVQQIEPAFTQAVINTDDAGASEEAERGASQLVAQLMELIQAMLPAQPLRALLKQRVRSLLQLLVPFLRVTEAQARAWREDPNEFLAQEDDDPRARCATRLSGEYLVSELLTHMKREAGRDVAALTGQLLERGEAGAAAGDAGAWKLTELALLLFGIACDAKSVQGLQRGDFATLVPVVLGAAGRLCADRSAPDLLRARAFAMLRRSGDAVCALLPKDLPALLEASAAALAPSEPMVVRVCALRAFTRFLTAVRDKALCDKLLLQCGVLASLGSLARAADEELLHLTLESLCVITRQCPETITGGAASFAVLVQEIWRRSSADPMVGLQVLDLVSCATGSTPELQGPMEEGLMPGILHDIQTPSAEPFAASSAVQLYGVLLKRAAVPFTGQIWQCVQPLLALIARSDESGFLENACDVLICIVNRSHAQLLESGLLMPLLQCVEHLLGPGLEDQACTFVGPFLLQLLSKFGSQLPAEVVTGLLRAVLLRLARARLPFVKQELLVVLGRMLHEDLPGVLAALGGMRLPISAGDGSPPVERGGFELLLSIWLASTDVVRARRARNVTFSALCRLHAAVAADPALRELRLDGQPLAAGQPLADRLLAAVVEGLEFENDRSQKLKKVPDFGSESEEEDDDEEDDDDDERQGENSKTCKFLSDLVDLEDDEDDLDDILNESGGGDTYQEMERSDPLHSLDLRKHVAEYLAAQPPSAARDAQLAQRMAAALQGAAS